MKKLLTSLLGVFSGAALFIGSLSLITNNAFAIAADAFDYSKDENSTSISSGDLIEKIVGEEIDEIEKTYINQNYSNYSLTYGNNLSTVNNITAVEYYNNLYVTVEPYAYVDKNNHKLTWLPYSATYNGQFKNVLYSNNEYKFTFDNYDGSNKTVNVNYKLELTLPKNEVNSLLNYAYNDALPGYNKLVENIELKNNYDSALENYHNYLQAVEDYPSKKATYEQYLKDKIEYDIKLEEYNSYLESYKKYEQDLAKYNKYLEDLEAYNNQVIAYAQYLNDLEYYNNNYEANREIYDAYKSSKEKIDYRLRAMQIIYESMTEYERTIYDAVIGSSVTSVLSRKEDIVTLGGVPEEAVDRASVATNELRIVFNDYAALETDAERYEYYRLNWSHIRDNVNELARCLEKFLRYDVVFNILAGQENNRLEKYLILVAQLIYLAEAINNTNVYNYEGWNTLSATGSLNPKNAAYLDSNYKIRVGSNTYKTYLEILDGVELMDISSKYGRPGPEKFDQDLIDLMTPPDPVEAPGEAPTPVKEPVEPKKVENPGSGPEVVENPGNFPEAVECPVEPEYISLNDLEMVLGGALLEGKIVKRTKFTSDAVVTFDDSKEFDFSDSLKHLVKIYDTENEYVTEKIISNGIIINDNEITNYNFDKIYENYSFIYKDIEGNTIDLSTLGSSMNLYAEIVPGNLREYTIKWIIDGIATYETLHYGDDVNPPENPAKDDSSGCYYSFLGWDKTISPVTKNETYTAIFNTHHYTYVTKIVDGNPTYYVFREDNIDLNFEVPEKQETVTKYYIFDKWNVTKTDQYHLTYTAVFKQYSFIFINWYISKDVYVLNDKYKQGETIAYPYSTPTKAGDENYSCYIMDYWMDSNGNEIDLNSITYSINLYAHFIGTDSEIYTVYFIVDGEVVYSNNYSYGMMPHVPTVSKEDTDNGYYAFLGWDKDVTEVTETTSYYAQFEFRYYIYVTIIIEGNTSNQIVKSIDDLVINTPAKPASNGYTYVFKEWKVTNVDDTHYIYEAVFDSYFVITFIVEGVLTQETYKVGEEIEVQKPTKKGNEVYYYVFAGWKNSLGQFVNISDVNYSITLYAVFNEQYVVYSVTWVMGENEVVAKYHYGDTLTLPEDTSRADSDKQYFTFNRWDKTIDYTVTKNAKYTAIYDAHYFTMVKVNLDGEIIIYRFKEGESINIPTPEKGNDDYHDYVFIGWDVQSIENNHTYLYTPKYNITTYCYITWVVDGVVVAKDKYVVGSSVMFKGNEPYKNEEETIYYVFVGWGVNLKTFKAYSDTTLTAVFNKMNKIAVVWLINGTSLVEYYKPGEKLCLPNAYYDSYYDNEYYYEFTGWNDEFVDVVTTTQIYTAKYNKHALFNASGNNGSIQLTLTNDEYVLTLEFDSSFSVNYEYFLKMISETNSTSSLNIQSSKCKLTLDSNRLKYLYTNGYFNLNFNYEISETYSYSFSYSISRNDGASMPEGNLNIKAVIKGNFDQGRSYLYIDDKKVEADFSNDEVYISNFECKKVYVVITTYMITFEYSPNYTCTLSKNSAEFNELITYTITPSNGYNIKSIYYFYNGNKVELTNDSFRMPDSDVTIKVDLEQIEYTILFEVDGQIVATYVGHYGDVVVDPALRNPEIVEKKNSATHRYVFVGWDSEITTIDGNKTYKAVFEEIPLADNSIQQKTSILFILLIVGGCTLAAAGAGFVVFKKLKRKK